MARFKKRRSKPIPGPGDSREPAKEMPAETPETEKVKREPAAPPAPPFGSDAEKSEKDKKLNKLFWIRVGLAVIAGTAATFIFEEIEGEERRWASIGFMIVIFFGSIIYAKSLKMQLPSSDRKKIVTQGIGSYIFLYLFVWILSYTIVNTGTTPVGITSPIP